MFVLLLWILGSHYLAAHAALHAWRAPCGSPTSTVISTESSCEDDDRSASNGVASHLASPRLARVDLTDLFPGGTTGPVPAARNVVDFVHGCVPKLFRFF
jgi:hypothetical protein